MIIVVNRDNKNYSQGWLFIDLGTSYGDLPSGNYGYYNFSLSGKKFIND